MAGESERIACHLVACTQRFLASGALGFVEGAEVAAHNRDFDATIPTLGPIEQLQFLVNMSLRGGGRKDRHRERLFALREMAYVALFFLGYDIERIAGSVNLSTSQLQSMKLLKAARTFMRALRASAIGRWHAEGAPTVWIARCYGLTEKEVQRLVKKPVALNKDDMRLYQRLCECSPPWLKHFLELCLLEWMAPGFAHANGNPQPFFGIPRYDYPEAPEPYHSWATPEALLRLAEYIVRLAHLRTGRVTDPEEARDDARQLAQGLEENDERRRERARVLEPDGEPQESTPIVTFIPSTDGILPPALYALLTPWPERGPIPR
jgi:hypothetical protein